MYIKETDGKAIGLATSIVKTLRDYRKPLPVGYLARIHGRTQADIEPYLSRLQQEGLIEYERNNEVKLAQPNRPKAS